MGVNEMYTFTCEKCGGQFYSKADPSGWRHKICNACSGKPYKDLPVEGNTPMYQPKPVPAKPTYNKPAYTPTKVEKQEFNLDNYIADMLVVYNALKIACEEYKIDIPEESLCSWTTSIMIQKGRM